MAKSRSSSSSYSRSSRSLSSSLMSAPKKAVGEVSDMISVSKVGVSSSLRLWKLSFLMLFIALIIFVVVVAMPNTYEVDKVTYASAVKAANILHFVGVWLGIAVWIYRLVYKMPVMKYWMFGFVLAVLLPPLIVMIAEPTVTQPSAVAQLKNVLKM